jgi:hypothetical protein
MIGATIGATPDQDATERVAGERRATSGIPETA